MIVVVDDRSSVKEGFVSLFDRVGVSAAGLCGRDCRSWVLGAPPPDILAIEAFLVGECRDRGPLSRTLRRRSSAAMIAVSEHRSLADTLELFEAGFDDVVRQPIHVSEIMARITAIRRRAKPAADAMVADGILIHADGRDPEVGGDILALPRRERRILEYLVANKGCWVTKSQIFNSVYGIFSDNIGETVVESHVSKLRKRLRGRLGRDPIESQRHFGYRLEGE